MRQAVYFVTWPTTSFQHTYDPNSLVYELRVDTRWIVFKVFMNKRGCISEVICEILIAKKSIASVWCYKFYIDVFTSRPFLKTAGGIVLGSVAVSAVSADVLPYISVAIKASFLKLGMCNICKNNIAKMFLDFWKILNCSFDRRF